MLPDGGTWRLSCDWASLGLAFPETYSELDGPRPRRWLRIERPVYDGNQAVVETAYVPGPRAGGGWSCQLSRQADGTWTLGMCRRGWVS